MPKESFSFKELRGTARIKPGPTESIVAEDGIKLSYRRYIPASPIAAVLFYHGGGAHSGAGYQYLANGLQSEFSMAVYTPDIRGHGNSGGNRGDTPAPEQVWSDISTFIKRIRTEFPDHPLFLGGHSSGAGLSLNYASQPDREQVNGFVFLSPQLGAESKTERESTNPPFAKVNGADFILNATTEGRLAGHNYAVRFNYPEELLAADPGLVGAITVNMSRSLIPAMPEDQFKSIDRPFGLWIGSDDELFLPEKVIAFGNSAKLKRNGSVADIIPGAKHLSVLLNAHKIIGPWITQMVTKSEQGNQLYKRI
jgi:alpha-beta hydrolase superfamily lysophospholipase